jgi:hypothetical protein
VLSLPRLSQYLAGRPELEVPYREAARFVASRGWLRLGLVCNGDDGECPLWVFLGDDAGYPVRIEHVDVQNWSNKFRQDKDFLPEAVLCIGREPADGLVRSLSLREVWRSGPIRIWATQRTG